MPVNVQLANRALIKLGVQTIANPLENTEPARVMRVVYDDLCRSELRINPWLFAIGRVDLPALLTPPTFGYANQFELPSDFIRVVQIGDFYDFAAVREGTNAPFAPYSIEGSAILTNYGAPLRLRYIRDVTEAPDIWDVSFREAFACRLAMEVCETLKKSTSAYAKAKEDYRDAIREARRLNAIESPPQFLPDNSWVLARYI